VEGYANTLEFACDSKKTTVVNGETYELGQGCSNCKTWIRGEHDFKHCPNCGAALAYTESPS